MTDRSTEIRELCDRWVDASSGPDGGMQIGGETEQYRLLRNGIAFHELGHAELRAACLGLTVVLLRPGLNTVVDRDHQWFWAWCAEVLVGSRASYFESDEHELRDLMSLACRSSLAGISPPDREGWERQRDQMMAMEPNARELMNNSHRVLAYLSFPLLEGVLKKECRDTVALDGTVQQEFSVPGRNSSGPRRKYQPGATCSSLRDLLWLLTEVTRNDELRHDLESLRVHVRALSESDDAYDLLYRWRNSSLHGATAFSTIGGTVLNTTLLVAMSSLAEGYDAVREVALDHVRRELMLASAATPFRSPWSFYPAHL